MKRFAATVAAGALALSGAAFTGCGDDNEGPAEDAGKAVDEAGRDVGEEVEDAGKEAERELDDDDGRKEKRD